MNQKTAVIYTRFSSDRQNETSTEAQVRACHEYASSHTLNVIKVFSDEAISGKGTMTNKRAEYQSMLRYIKTHHVDVLLFHKYDRIARSLAEHVTLEQKLAQFNTQPIAVAQDIGTSNESKLVKTLLWSLSEYYVDNLSTETKKGHKEIALKGLHNGGYPPFGYEIVDKKYVICEREAVWVRKMAECCINGTGFTKLIAQMKACDVVGKRGNPISYSQIYEILSNEKLTGTYVYSVDEEKNRTDRRTKPNAIRIENAFPAILTKEEFAEVKKIMKSHKLKSNPNTYLCSGLVYCSCGAKMHVFKSTNKGHTYHYYRCSEKCGAPGIPVYRVDDAVYSYIKNLLSDETQHKIFTCIRFAEKNEKQTEIDFKKVLKKKIEEKEKQYNSLMHNLSLGALPQTVVEDAGKELENIKSEIETLKNTEPPKEIATPHIVNWLENIKHSPSEDAVRLLVERINVKNNNAIEVHSTLMTLLNNLGCGSPQPSLPKILFGFRTVINTAL